ncbi:glycosyltransferase [Saliphagus infecundisoli]|uniref:Glycosyltransferase n=1 Tax=Saliphagus infecundisoli TaxID=1849069 RepID=A0ABD5QL70_9EURY|nr:glycosyltransferase [Saliphagus infecundisoli]
MKVLQLITSTRSFFEGQVEALEERGVECTVVDAPGAYSADSPRTVTDYLKYQPKVLRELRREEYDLVHANYGLVGPFALAQPVRPVVLTLWGTDLMSEMAWLRATSEWSARLADAVVVPSPAMSRALDVDHVEIPFGIDTDLFRQIPRAEARERIGWDPEGAVALFPYDSARPEKDYTRAERIVRRAGVDVELREVTGVPHEEMPDYMNASDVLLVTSVREAGPMVVKEAAACGLPIVSTDVGFVRETVGGLDTCTVARSDSGLVAGLEAAVESDARPDGRAGIDGLSTDAMGEKLLELYERLCDEPEPRADRRAG